jgi:hypothetical protein
MEVELKAEPKVELQPERKAELQPEQEVELELKAPGPLEVEVDLDKEEWLRPRPRVQLLPVAPHIAMTSQPLSTLPKHR